MCIRDRKVCAEIAKTEKKVEDLQGQLKELYDKKTELENLEIVNTVRAMVMDKDQIMAFLAASGDMVLIGNILKRTVKVAVPAIAGRSDAPLSLIHI